jgi:hypothetical protein
MVSTVVDHGLLDCDIMWPIVSEEHEDGSNTILHKLVTTYKTTYHHHPDWLS